MWGYQIIAFGGVGVFLHAFLTCLSWFQFEPNRYEKKLKKLYVLLLMIGFGGLAIQSFGLFMLLLNDVFLQQDYAAGTIQYHTQNILFLAGFAAMGIFHFSWFAAARNVSPLPLVPIVFAVWSSRDATPWLAFLLG